MPRRPGPAASARAAAAALALRAMAALPRGRATVACAPGETLGEVEGASGTVCATPCNAADFSCQRSVMTAATAECMLKDVSNRPLCGLLCQVDAQCPDAMQCRQLSQLQVGICNHPISFTEWAVGTGIQKLAVGWTRPASGNIGKTGVANFQILQTYNALQALKATYGIDDGDADMLVLKELLSTLKSAGTASGSPAAGAAGAGGAGAAGAPGAAAGGAAGTGWMPHGLDQLEKYAGEGLPGIAHEMRDIEWNLEHLDKRNAATNTLSGLFWMVFFYLAIGAFFKYQLGARGADMIPHVGFWVEYPSLVVDGFTYSKILLGVKPPDAVCGGVRGGTGAFEQL